MGLFDGMLGGVVGAEMATVVNGLIERHGGVEGVVNQLRANGLGPTVNSWIKEGPNVEDYRKGYQQWTGQEPTDEVVASFTNHWRRDRLSFFSEALPQEWKKRYEKLVAEYGPAEHPEFLSYVTEATFVSSTSPKSAEELKLMSAKDIISYLKSWKPSPTEADSPLRPSPSQEGLGRALTSIVETEPARFAKRRTDGRWVSAVRSGKGGQIKLRRRVDFAHRVLALN